MPPTQPSKPPKPRKTLEAVVEEVGLYPIDAYEFVTKGLHYTVQKIHGDVEEKTCETASGKCEESLHVNGRDLCLGLREFALLNWGLLASTVLERWNVRRTLDFGRIVFAMVDNGHMKKTDEDKIDDFREVFDFKSGLESGYKIGSKIWRLDRNEPNPLPPGCPPPAKKS
jgi:uncharacterized repeat protein (TIGR04138 family)